MYNINMKKILVLFVCLFLVFYVSSCFKKKSDGKSKYFGLYYRELPEAEDIIEFKKEFKYKPRVVAWVRDWEAEFPIENEKISCDLALFR
jgi:hypothetical protein